MGILEVKNITKNYGKNLILQGINLNVDPSQIFAFIGPNGAGKTTFLKAVLNLTSITTGEILLNGISWRDYHARATVAYFPEKFSFFGYYTVYDTLLFYGRMAGRDKKDALAQIPHALEKCSISELASRQLGVLSKGQWQRVGLACVLMSKADLLILDEPFSGLDPIGMRDFRQILQDLKVEGKTIFLNSHLLSEVEKLADYTAIINHGRILAQGKLPELCGGKSLEDYCCDLIEADKTKAAMVASPESNTVSSN